MRWANRFKMGLSSILFLFMRIQYRGSCLARVRETRESLCAMLNLNLDFILHDYSHSYTIQGQKAHFFLYRVVDLTWVLLQHSLNHCLAWENLWAPSESEEKLRKMNDLRMINERRQIQPATQHAPLLKLLTTSLLGPEASPQHHGYPWCHVLFFFFFFLLFTFPRGFAAQSRKLSPRWWLVQVWCVFEHAYLLYVSVFTRCFSD